VEGPGFAFVAGAGLGFETVGTGTGPDPALGFGRAFGWPFVGVRSSHTSLATGALVGRVDGGDAFFPSERNLAAAAAALA